MDVQKDRPLERKVEPFDIPRYLGRLLAFLVAIWATMALTFSYAVLLTNVELERLAALGVGLKESVLPLSITSILSFLFGFSQRTKKNEKNGSG